MREVISVAGRHDVTVTIDPERFETAAAEQLMQLVRHEAEKEHSRVRGHLQSAVITARAIGSRMPAYYAVQEFNSNSAALHFFLPF